MPTATIHPMMGYRGMISRTVSKRTTATITVLIRMVCKPSLCSFISKIEEPKLGKREMTAEDV